MRTDQELLVQIRAVTAEIVTHYAKARSNLDRVLTRQHLNEADRKEEILAGLKRELFKH